MKNIRNFYLKIFIFFFFFFFCGKIFNIFESACFRNVKLLNPDTTCFCKQCRSRFASVKCLLITTTVDDYILSLCLSARPPVRPSAGKCLLIYNILDNYTPSEITLAFFCLYVSATLEIAKCC